MASRRVSALSLTLLGALVLTLLGPIGTADEEKVQDRLGDGIAWHTDLAKARGEATARKRPLFVVFRCVP